MKKLLLIIFLFYIYVPADGQVNITFTPERDSVNIGDPVSLRLEVVIPAVNEAPEIDFSPLFEMENLIFDQDTILLDKTADIAILSAGSILPTADQPIVSSEGLWRPKGEVQILAADLIIGIYNIGVFTLNPPLVEGNEATALPLEPKLIIVMPPAGIQDSLSLTPIKPIMEEPVIWQDYLPYLYALLSLILLSLLGYFIFRKRHPEKFERKEPAPVVLPPHVIALQKLHRLREEALWEKGEIKAYQSQLTYIIREYLEGRFNIAALEMTTSEILKDLHQKEFYPEHTGHLRNILEMADLIKFAKAKPTNEIHSHFMDLAINFVIETKDPKDIEEV